MNKKATIIDLDIGNIFSLRSALKFCGIQTIISSDIKEIENSQNIILPGDGAFPYSMKKIKEKKLFDFLKNIKKSKKNFLGVCVGMQLLFEKSFEHNETDGLSVLKGEVKLIPNFSKEEMNKRVEIPNIGWHSLHIKKENQEFNLLKNINNLSNVYFIHSYHAELTDSKIESAFIDYFGHKVTATVQDGNVSACQFHPEKSGETGLKILKNFFRIY